MKLKFEQVPVGGKFSYKGIQYSKIATSMTQDENQMGMIFHPEAPVESLEGDEVLAESNPG